jgi:hypothetical protein
MRTQTRIILITTFLFLSPLYYEHSKGEEKCGFHI